MNIHAQEARQLFIASQMKLKLLDLAFIKDVMRSHDVPILELIIEHMNTIPDNYFQFQHVGKNASSFHLAPSIAFPSNTMVWAQLLCYCYRWKSEAQKVIPDQAAYHRYSNAHQQIPKSSCLLPKTPVLTEEKIRKQATICYCSLFCNEY